MVGYATYADDAETDNAVDSSANEVGTAIDTKSQIASIAPVVCCEDILRPLLFLCGPHEQSSILPLPFAT